MEILSRYVIGLTMGAIFALVIFLTPLFPLHFVAHIHFVALKNILGGSLFNSVPVVLGYSLFFLSYIVFGLFADMIIQKLIPQSSKSSAIGFRASIVFASILTLTFLIISVTLRFSDSLFE